MVRGPDYSELDDAALVDYAKRNGRRGRRAFDMLVERHQSWLVRLLHYMTGNRADAEEIAQDVFVRAYAGMKRYRGARAFRGWLRVIAVRQAYNHSRARGSRLRRESEVGESIAQGSPGPDVVERQALQKVLLALPYPYREALLLRHVEELSVQEIAAALDIGESAAKMRLSRARAAFWDVYEEMTNA